MNIFSFTSSSPLYMKLVLYQFRNEYVSKAYIMKFFNSLEVLDNFTCSFPTWLFY